MQTIPTTTTTVKNAACVASHIKRRRRTRAEVEQLDGALENIVAEQKPMTVRQVFYQGTVRGLVPKDESKGYSPIQRRLVSLRRSGRMPYNWITDNIRFVRGYNRYGGVAEFAEEVAGLYRRDYWRDADCVVEIWIEKDALASVISPVVINKWGLDLHVARGFSSLSYLHEAAEALIHDGRPAHIYILTDLDPSGIHIARDIGSKLREMVGNRVDLHVDRLAVEAWQVKEWNLPTRPTKRGDTRAKAFKEQFGDFSVELDAIPPNTLRQLVDDAIARHADAGKIQRLKVIEQAERESIARFQASMGGTS